VTAALLDPRGGGERLSLGVFAQWQPVYAERGIATVPCSREKRPLVKHPEKFGCKASAQIAQKFPEATALGFYAGSRNKRTVLDIDTTYWPMP